MMHVIARFQGNSSIQYSCVNILVQVCQNSSIVLGMRTFMTDPSMEVYARMDSSLQAELYTLLRILLDSDSSDQWLQTKVWRLLARTQPAARVMACLENNSIAMETVIDEIFSGLR